MSCLKDVIIQELRLVLHQRLLAVTQEILGHVESAVSLALDETRTKQMDFHTFLLHHQSHHESAPPVASCVFPDGSQSMSSPATQEDPLSYNSREEFVHETSVPEMIKEPVIVKVETQPDFIIMEQRPQSVVVESEKQETINQTPDFRAPISDDDGNKSESHELPGDFASYSNDSDHVERITLEAEPFSSNLMQTESGEWAFICDVCGRKFKYLYNLKQHKTIHTADQGHRCSFCKKIFSTRANLQTHVRIHTGEKPYKCDCCGKAFTQKFDLKRHKRTHTGERPYACDICGERFTLNGNLKAHRVTHTGLKPYHCITCGKKFNQKISMKRHKCVEETETTMQREQKKRRS